MLKHRIAELGKLLSYTHPSPMLIEFVERQIAEMGGTGSVHSPLAGPPTIAAGEPAPVSAKAE